MSKVWGVCGNCGQYARGETSASADCFHECRARGFADEPEPLRPCPQGGQAQPCCITPSGAPFYVTGVTHVCGR